MARRALFVALLVGALALPSGTARAWTEAVVRSVNARVVLESDASARVDLLVTVRVRGGWLEGMELSGFDPDLVLVEEVVPWAEDDAGERYTPNLRVLADGRVQLDFRDHSPRRGQLRIGLAYRTSLAHRATEPLESEDAVRVRWTLPGWRAGLDGVQIEVVAPDGSIPGPRDAADTGASMSRTVETGEGGVTVRWRRAHLPRTVPWTVAVDVPASAMSPALRGPPSLAPIAPSPSALPHEVVLDPRISVGVLALVFALLALLALLTTAGAANRARVPVTPLVPLPALLRGALALGLVAGAGFFGVAHPLASLAALTAAVLLVLERPSGSVPEAQLGAWRVANSAWLSAARRERRRAAFGAQACLDATTPLGVVHLALWLAFAFAPLPALDAIDPALRYGAVLLAATLLVTGTRLSRPTGPALALGRLLASCRSMRSLPDGVALRPVVHLDVRGGIQDARVRTTLEHRPEGLLRLDLVLAQMPHAGGWSARRELLVLTRAGSPADETLTESHGDGEASRGGRRVARRFPVDALGEVVEALAVCPSAAEVERGAPAQQETVRDVPPPAAVGM